MSVTMNPNGNILVFTPTLSLPANPFEYQSGLLKIINQIQQLKMGFAYLPTYRQYPWPAINQSFDIAFQNNFEYILRLDDDIHSIPDEAIKKLVEANKDVIGAAYPRKTWPHFTCALNRTKNKSLIEIGLMDDPDEWCLQYVTEDDPKREGERENAIVPVELIGFGMCLIKIEKFRSLKRPIFLGNEDVLDDTFFGQLCLDNGIQQYVHFGVRVAHAWVNYGNAGFLYNAGLYARQQAEIAHRKELKEKGIDVEEETIPAMDTIGKT